MNDGLKKLESSGEYDENLREMDRQSANQIRVTIIKEEMGGSGRPSSVYEGGSHAGFLDFYRLF